MRRTFLFAVATGLALLASASADDKTRAHRPPAFEPAYDSASPGYALLLFGDQTPRPVWVVVGDNQVYVDCNANGDLTEPGEKFALSAPQPYGGNYVEERWAHRIEIMTGRLKHTDFSIRQLRVREEIELKTETDKQLKDQMAKSKEPFVYYLSINVQVPELPRGKIPFTGRISQYAGHDAEGYLQFAPKSSDAPVVHFGGPFEMALLNRHTLAAGEKPSDLMTMIGTPGRGPGTFASVGFGGVFSDEVHPVAEIEFPAKTPGAEPPRTRFLLKHRC